MPRERITMRKVKEILRLKYENGLSNRQIALSCCVSRPTVADYIRRAKQTGLTWPISPDIDDAGLERLLFKGTLNTLSCSRIEPDWSKVHEELKNKDVTKALLWQEYKEQYPDGYQYTRFCQLYRRWLGKLDVVMRQDHKAGGEAVCRLLWNNDTCNRP